MDQQVVHHPASADHPPNRQRSTRPLRLLLRNHQAPGDVLMLTAAVRDLHRAHPGTYVTAVETSCPELWQNNPLSVAPGVLGNPDRVIDCQYPLVHDSNRRPYHFIHGFTQDLERQLGVPIPAGAFKADLYLSDQEVQQPSPVAALGLDGPYWVVIAGGKFDFTAKWWDPASFQAVVDHFRGAFRFVQCGAPGDWHTPLDGVVDLVGRTSVRDLIRVIYHAEGVLCPVTFAMHLAAAVPARPGRPPLRPCVVVAGGREPPQWEMYPGHQFLHTVGALQCCGSGGCWKSRCQLVGDGDEKDRDLCVWPVTTAAGIHIPKCMEMITPQKVIDAIQMYYQGGALKQMQPKTPLQCDRSHATRPGEIAVAPSPPPLARNADAPASRPKPPGVAVTIGVGSYLEMARLAAREVAALTGLETLVLDDDVYASSGLEHPDFLKFRLFDLVDADNILFFDADLVCLERWDPSAFFGRPSVACVRDRMVPELRAEAGEWGVPPEQYFNAGLFIISRPEHHEWLRRVERIRFRRPTRYYAQSPLNAARHELGIPLHLLDRRYNWVGFGASSLSHEMPVIMAHKLAPERHDLNVAFFEGRYELLPPGLVLNDITRRRVGGKTFLHLGEDGARHTLTLREDGTLIPPAAPEDEGYWFVHDVNGRPRLAFACETRVKREFLEVFGGNWVETASRGGAGGGARLVDTSAPQGLKPNRGNARDLADASVRAAPPYPLDRFAGRGIVICGGGERYFPSAWVCVRMLRHFGCDLPIELWQLTASELGGHLRSLVQPLGVRCVNADEIRLRNPLRMLNGWELKPYAVTHSGFEEVILLDADNVPLRDPSFLFDEAEYRRTGAVFWPDFGRLGPDREIWRICRVPYRDEPEFESGQAVIDKRRCWRALQLTMHLNDHSDFYYEHVYGDKETFHMAWRMLDQDYAMVPWPLYPLGDATMCQHDFAGKRLFQHRHRAKWSVRGDNRRVEGFELEDLCLQFLDELVSRWGPVGFGAGAVAGAPQSASTPNGTR